MIGIAIAALAAACLSSCVTETIAQPATGGQGGARVTMGPVHHLEEVMGADTANCRIDAGKICAAYAPKGSAPRSVSLAAPGGVAITVQCQYSGGALSAAVAAPDASPDKETAAFLMAHGFCSSR